MEHNVVFRSPTTKRGVADGRVANSDEMHASVIFFCVYTSACMSDVKVAEAKDRVEGRDWEREVPDEKGCMVSVSPGHHGCRFGLTCEWEEIRSKPSSEGVLIVSLNGHGRECGTMHDMSINFPTEDALGREKVIE